MVGVPWFVGGGETEQVLHGAEVARLLAYECSDGHEGIIGSPDLEVRELATPGTAVRVFPGACSILARHLGGDYQAYADYMPSQEQVPVPATDATGPRSDLVIRRVENPYAAGESWAVPTDPANGPYIHNRLITDIGQYVTYDPTLVTSVHELGQGWTAIDAARIDMPASTGTVTQDLITDLRRIARPRSVPWQYSVQHSTSNLQSITSATGIVHFPNSADVNVDVPPWATIMDFAITLHGVRFDGQDFTDHDVYGAVYTNIDGTNYADTIFNRDWSSRFVEYTIGTAGAFWVTGVAGQKLRLRPFAEVRSATAGVEMEAFDTSTLMQIQFRQQPVSNI